MGEAHRLNITNREPANVVVFVWRCIHDLAMPGVDEPDGELEPRIPVPDHRIRTSSRQIDVHTEFLSQLTHQSVPRILTVVDMTAGKIPHVGVPTPVGSAMAEKDPVG